jgi:hypothetical protein
MSQLEPVTLSFEGKEYTVDKEAGIWGLIEAIENVITFFEIAPALAEGRYPTARIFRAYAAALTYAGRRTTANEVREASNYQNMGEMAGALATILMMAQPGADVDLGEQTASEQEAESVKKKAKAD